MRRRRGDAEERSEEGQPPGRVREGSRSQSTSGSEEEVGGACGKPTARAAELMRQLQSALGHECEMKLELERVREDHEREVSELNSKIREGKEKYTALWCMNCEQLSEYDEAIASRDEELQVLRTHVEGLEAHSTHEYAPHESNTRDGSTAGVGKCVGRDVIEGAVVPVSDPGHDLTHPLPLTSPVGEGGVPPSHAASSLRVGGASVPPVTLLGGRGLCRGKAPPVNPFDRETPDVLFKDWVPALYRAADWNGWSKEETLIQLAGHLRGHALQEWSLLSTCEESLQELTKAMHSRLGPCSRVLAVQDFCHASQHDDELLSDFIRRLQQLFKLAYGWDGVSEETRSTLLHSQLQEGFRYEIMKAPAVSGSYSYKELCLASRNEEKRLTELAKRRQYHNSQ